MKANDNNISVEDLKQHFVYDSNTGELRWSSHHSNRRKGMLAGRIDDYGYRRVEFQQKDIYAHRIIWAMYYGRFPTKFIDHLDGSRTNNKISNLKEATQRENQNNLPCHRSGKLVGASFDPRINKWVSRIGVGYKDTKRTIYLGSFDTEVKAHRKYVSVLKSKNKVI